MSLCEVCKKKTNLPRCNLMWKGVRTGITSMCRSCVLIVKWLEHGGCPCTINMEEDVGDGNG